MVLVRSGQIILITCLKNCSADSLSLSNPMLHFAHFEGDRCDCDQLPHNLVSLTYVFLQMPSSHLDYKLMNDHVSPASGVYQYL